MQTAPPVLLVSESPAPLARVDFSPAIPRTRKAVATPLVTRARLGGWGFRRLPDVWLPCPREGRYAYFERWYHAQWNYTAIINWPGKDPLVLTEDDFLASIQAHILDDTEGEGHDSWDDIYGGW